MLSEALHLKREWEKGRRPLWPAEAELERYAAAFVAWRTARHFEKAEGAVCYHGCCGIGHRTRRTLSTALQSWAVGQPVVPLWPRCGSNDTFEMLHSAAVLQRDHTAWFNTLGAGKNTCAERVNNEPQFRADFEAEGLAFYRGPEISRVKHPVTPLFFGILQHAFQDTEAGASVQATLKSRNWAAGNIVVGVHLRMGNGEQAAIKDNRTATLDAHRLFQYVSRTVDRVAREELKVDPKAIRIFLASDSRSTLEAFRNHDRRAFFYKAGAALDPGEGVNIGKSEDPRCAALEQASMIDAVLLGYSDVLITPQWSELTLLSKVMVMERGGMWCENQRWLHKSNGEIPDPSSAKIEIERGGADYICRTKESTKAVIGNGGE